MVVIHPDYGVVVGKETAFRNAVILDLNLHSPYELKGAFSGSLASFSVAVLHVL